MPCECLLLAFINLIDDSIFVISFNESKVLKISIPDFAAFLIKRETTESSNFL